RQTAPLTVQQFAAMGGHARASELTKERRKEIARKAAQSRWEQARVRAAKRLDSCVDWTNCPFIDQNPEIEGGRPTIPGNRIPAITIVKSWDQGMTEQAIARELGTPLAKVRALLRYCQNHKKPACDIDWSGCSLVGPDPADQRWLVVIGTSVAAEGIVGVHD